MINTTKWTVYDPMNRQFENTSKHKKRFYSFLTDHLLNNSSTKIISVLVNFFLAFYCMCAASILLVMAGYIITCRKYSVMNGKHRSLYWFLLYVLFGNLCRQCLTYWLQESRMVCENFKTPNRIMKPTERDPQNTFIFTT